MQWFAIIKMIQCFIRSNKRVSTMAQDKYNFSRKYRVTFLQDMMNVSQLYHIFSFFARFALGILSSSLASLTTELVFEVAFDVFGCSYSCKAFVFKQHATSSGWRDFPHVTQITRSEDNVRVVVALLGFNGSLGCGCEACSWAVIMLVVYSKVVSVWLFTDS